MGTEGNNWLYHRGRGRGGAGAHRAPTTPRPTAKVNDNPLLVKFNGSPVTIEDEGAYILNQYKKAPNHFPDTKMLSTWLQKDPPAEMVQDVLAAANNIAVQLLQQDSAACLRYTRELEILAGMQPHDIVAQQQMFTAWQLASAEQVPKELLTYLADKERCIARYHRSDRKDIRKEYLPLSTAWKKLRQFGGQLYQPCKSAQQSPSWKRHSVEDEPLLSEFAAKQYEMMRSLAPSQRFNNGNTRSCEEARLPTAAYWMSQQYQQGNVSLQDVLPYADNRRLADLLAPLTKREFLPDKQQQDMVSDETVFLLLSAEYPLNEEDVRSWVSAATAGQDAHSAAIDMLVHRESGRLALKKQAVDTHTVRAWVEEERPESKYGNVDRGWFPRLAGEGVRTTKFNAAPEPPAEIQQFSMLVDTRDMQQVDTLTSAYAATEHAVMEHNTSHRAYVQERIESEHNLRYGQVKAAWTAGAANMELVRTAVSDILEPPVSPSTAATPLDASTVLDILDTV